MKKIVCLLLLVIFFLSCKKDLPIIPHQPTPYTIVSPSGFPNMLIPENNPMTVEGIALGKKLFHDPILSGDGTQSCSSCHLQSAAFSDTNRFSQGIDGSFD